MFDIVAFIAKEAQRDDILTRANSVAFSFFLALFPSLIVFLTFLPYIPVDNLTEIIQEFLDKIMPHEAEGFIFSTLDNLTNIPRGGTLSIGVILALFFSSNGMLELMNGFNKSYYMHTFKRRGFIRKRILAIGLTLVLGLLLIIAGVMIVLGNVILSHIFEWLEMGRFSRLGFEALKWLVVLALIYSMVAFIFKYGPSLRKKSSYFSPGTTVAAVGIIIASVGFSFFVNNFGTYNRIYGSIGAIIVLMVWIQIISFILLAGFELNASIAVQRNFRKEKSNKPVW